MMAAQGWETTLYHNGASEAGATEEVRILSTEELTLLRRCYLRAVREMPYPVKASATQRDTHFRAIIDYSNRLAAKRAVGVADQAFEGDTAVLGSPHYNAFSKKLREELAARVQPGDIICHPFGKSHADLRAIFPFAAHVETGIGYPDAEWGATRIYETSAWMHYHLGRANRNGTDYDFVVPNYFDLSEWPVDARKENTGYILYFGRVIESKGMAIVRALADALGEEILIVGQGDLGPYAHPNLRKLPPVKGLERAALLAGARCLLMPTRFTEPFGGAGVEGMLCGTPLISSDYGAFQETNMQGVTGYRCHVLGDWIAAVAAVKTLDRAKVAEIARARYSLATCGKRYAQIFQMVTDRIAGAGWMTAQDRFLANS
jgi:glycosyltransferase involved in cell wall biosynthesis